MQLPSLVQNLSPKRKRAAVIAGVISVMVVGGLAFSGDPPRRTTKPKDEIVKHILSDRDTRQVSMDALAAQVKMLADEKRQMAADLERIKREGVAGGAAQQGQQAKQLNEETRRLESVVSDLSKKIDAMEAAQVGGESGVSRPRVAAPSRQGGEPVDPKVVFNSDSMRAGAPAGGATFQPNPAVPPTSPKEGATGSVAMGGIRLVNAQSEPATADRGKSKKSERGDSERPDPSRNAKKDAGANSGPLKEGEAYLPTGSIISGTLLTGIDAPTGQGARRDPAPALLRIKKEALLPNRYRADIRECFALVGGFGDLSSERAYLRGESISCVKNDGKIIESKLAGYTVGSDGKAGVRGRLVTKQGQLIARAMMAGFIQGVGKAFSYTPVPTLQTSPSGKVDYMQQLSPESMQSAGLSGVGDAMDRIAKFYIDMAEGMYPVIEVDAGREVEFVLNGGLRLKVI